MQVQTLIQPQAEIVNIIQLREGDVYKRLQEGVYGGTDEIKFGVVTGVVNNGTQSAITALEYAASYNSVTVEHKTFSGTKELAIFPANPIEFAEHIDSLLNALDNGIADKERDLAKQRDLRERVAKIKPGELTAAVTQAFPVKAIDKVNDASPAWHEGQTLPAADGDETVEL